MDNTFVYTRKRNQFGRKCNFSECEKLEIDLKPNPALMQNFIRVDPVTQATQCNKIYSAHEVNTTTATFKDSGMFHYEGGWPKDINTKDLEQTVRYRRKVEKDELYIHTMLQLLAPMEHCILQNNACNIYEEYFQDTEATCLLQRTYSRTVNVYRDLMPVKRRITHLSWSPDQGTRFAASYCNTDFQTNSNFSTISYIWDVENPNNPFLSLRPFSSIMALEYCPKDNNTLVSGFLNGQVAFWDIRKGTEPVETSLVEHSHRDPCSKVLWINSKTGTEFFSASKDGQVKWWDTRKMQAPTETLVIDLNKPEDQNIDKAIGISALQFEPSMGTRFMCGLENGIVISGNRKGKTPSEKMAQRFKAQHGPIISLERNPTFLKNFLTVGDWTSRIWSEDCRESCILWTPGYKEFLTGGAWSVTRFSVFFLIKMNGTLDAWDLLVQHDSPVLSVKVCDQPLTYIKPHEQGQLAAVSNKNGTTYLLEFSEALTTNQKNDKMLLTALLDRETRREKVIESKNREIRLKMKTVRVNMELQDKENPDLSRAIAESREQEHCDSHLINPMITQAEQDYEDMLEAEIVRRAAVDNSEISNNDIPNGSN
ncbi:dynein axonemal intermediate chain 2-like [Prorops nasuta]|uniref:dynein axonemal intermediate chain 2-like n=1 Tax=Prorops nasuta TaxID=863751 RepID=UPI0034CDE815